MSHGTQSHVAIARGLVTALFAASLLTACDPGSEPASHPSEAPVTQPQTAPDPERHAAIAPAPTTLRALAASASPLGRARSRIAAVERDAASFDIFATAPDGSVLYGRLATIPPPASDVRPAYEIRYLARTPGAAPVPLGTSLADAAFIQAGRPLAALIHVSGELVLLDPDRPAERAVLDRDVSPGLGISPSGASLVYAKGQLPEFDIWRLDLDTGGASLPSPKAPPARLTHDDAPDVLPAFSPDGERIAWVSSRTGVPSIWLMARDGSSSRQLTNIGLRPDRALDPARLLPSPERRSPPLWGAGLLVFESGDGVHAIAESTAALAWSLPGASGLGWLVPGEEIAVETAPRSFAAVRLAAKGGAP